MTYQPQLLSPAGNLEKLQFAFIYGADGAYLGGKLFNLRERAGNFSYADLRKAKKLADQYKKKINLTLNIYFYNNDFKKLGAYCDKLLEIGLNNVIVSDLGVIYFLNKHYKKQFNITASTQANISNIYAIQQLEELNVRRIVLARELSLKEIKEIKTSTSLEIETFMHGAMCVAYSGRCLLSEYMAGRSANRGDCTQSCRWDYYLVENQRKDEFYPILEDQKATTIMSSKDICTLPILHKLMKKRIDAFKIEGRMKSLYYVANVTRVYRHAIDALLGKKKVDMALLMQELDSISHRPFFTGFYEKPNSSINYENKYVRQYKFLGYLKRKVKNNLYEVVLKDKIELDDEIEIILPGMRNIVPKSFHIYDHYMNKTDRGIINRKFFMEFDQEVAPWGIIRKKGLAS